MFYSYRRCFSEPNIKYSMACLHKIKYGLLGLYGHLEANKHGKSATDISFTCTSSVQSAWPFAKLLRFPKIISRNPTWRVK